MTYIILYILKLHSLILYGVFWPLEGSATGFEHDAVVLSPRSWYGGHVGKHLFNCASSKRGAVFIRPCVFEPSGKSKPGIRSHFSSAKLLRDASGSLVAKCLSVSVAFGARQVEFREFHCQRLTSWKPWSHLLRLEEVLMRAGRGRLVWKERRRKRSLKHRHDK